MEPVKNDINVMNFMRRVWPNSPIFMAIVCQNMWAGIRGRHLFEADLYLTIYDMYPGDKGLESIADLNNFYRWN